MLTGLLHNPVFFIVLIGLILLTLFIVHIERLHMAHKSLDVDKTNPVYHVLESAEHKNCRLIFCQADYFREFGNMLECNIHNVDKEWVHVTYPINAEDDIHKIISMDKISSVEFIDDIIAS